MKWRYKVDHQIRSLDEIYSAATEMAKKYGPYRVAVAAGETKMSLGALKLGRDLELIEPILVGDQRSIARSFEEMEMSLKGWQVVAERDNQLATKKAAKMVTDGLADILMRGKVIARDFFKVLFEKELGLRHKGDMWNNIVLIDNIGLDRLIYITDCGLVFETDLAGRLKLIQNAIDFSGGLGLTNPKIAILAAVESVSPGMPVSIEAAAIAKMSDRGQFAKGVSIDGPLSLDLSLVANSVAKKKIDSPVAGKADILIVNELNAGNALYKTLVTLCGARSASTIAGAPIPIILTSRSETPENVMFSFALTILMAGAKDR